MSLSVSELDISVRFGLFVAGHFAVFYWVRHVVAPARASGSRFLWASISAPLLLLLGTMFSTKNNVNIFAADYAGSTFLWLTPFKIFAFCMNRGQLVKAYDSGSTSAFALGLLFPITVTFHEERVSKESEEGPKKRHAYNDARFSVVRFRKEEYAKEAFLLLAHLVYKVVFMVALKYGRHYFEDSGHLFWRDVCFGWWIYACTAFVIDFFSLILLLTLNIKLEASFDSPWLSQSVKEFWSRRYNLSFGITLRDVVYDPICEGCWVRGTKYFDRKKPTKLRKSIALFAAFVVSGIMHVVPSRVELLSELPILCGLFFPINAVIILLEEWLKDVFSKQKTGLKVLRALPSWLCQIYVMATMSVLSHYLFLPEHLKSGYVDDLMG